MAKKFRHVVEWYLSSMGKLGLSWNTQKTRHFLAKRLVKDLGDYYLSYGVLRKGKRLDRMAVREFRLRLKQEGFADATIIQYLGLGSIVINAALDYRDWDLPNPFDRATTGLKANVRHRELSPARQAEGLMRMRQPYRDMAALTFLAAFRPSEVCFLEWERIDGCRVLFREGVTTEHGGQKNKEDTPAVLGRKALEIIDRQPRVSRWVFCRRLHGEWRRIPYNTFYREWRKAFGDSSPHDGRHTFGGRARKRLGELDPVQRQMRHKRRETTEKHYAPVADDQAFRAVEAVEN